MECLMELLRRVSNRCKRAAPGAIRVKQARAGVGEEGVTYRLKY